MHKYPGEDHLKYSYGSTWKGLVAIFVALLFIAGLIIACQKVIVIQGAGKTEEHQPGSIDVGRNIINEDETED